MAGEMISFSWFPVNHNRAVLAALEPVGNFFELFNRGVSRSGLFAIGEC
jgi:hypothetical protein